MGSLFFRAPSRKLEPCFRQRGSPLSALRAVVLSTVCLAGCAETPGDAQTYRYPNPGHSAELRVDVRNFGGAAGFVRNEISLEAAGWSTGTIATLEHMSDARTVWLDKHRVRLCYVGAMDRGGPRWSGVLNGESYHVELVDMTNGAPCI